MSDKSEIERKIAALEFEREGAKTFGKEDRVKAIDSELKHWRAEAKKADGGTPADSGDGVISEAEAAKEGPIDGEKIANDLAAAHRKQKYGVADTPVIDEAEAAKEPTDAAEKRSNERADALRSEAAPDAGEDHIVSEAEVVAAEKRAEHIENEEPVDVESHADESKRTTQDSKPRTTRSK